MAQTALNAVMSMNPIALIVIAIARLIAALVLLSFPRLAKGGVLHEGQAIMAEAGPELITVSNGRAITELQEVHQFGGMFVAPTFGEPMPEKIDWSE